METHAYFIFRSDCGTELYFEVSLLIIHLQHITMWAAGIHFMMEIITNKCFRVSLS